LLNGIPINDQSTTQGLHDFGVDFINTIQQVEFYKGANGVHFGPSAIGGAVNFITDLDYENKISVIGNDSENNNTTGNYIMVTDSGWRLNFKGSQFITKTNSAIMGGTEKDSAKNKSLNFIAEKWLGDRLRFKSNVYSRQTLADYDGSKTKEKNHTGDNKMLATQLNLDFFQKNIQDSVNLHYHMYDREYNEDGILDEYYSKAVTLRGERKFNYKRNFSFGLGSEYKYDWGKFENRGSYSASTKGHIDNSAIFANIGYEFLKDTTLSIYGRSDKHKTTGNNKTYKANINKKLNNFEFGLTRSTGLRNPSIYELYGSDNAGYSGNKNLNPEKSSVSELNINYSASDNLIFSTTIFKSNIFDHVEYSNNKYINNSTKTNLNQSGIENEIFYKKNNYTLSLFASSLSSKKTDGSDQIRRPEQKYGIKFNKEFNLNEIGPININLNYLHFGKHWDTHSDNWSTILMPRTDLINLNVFKNFLGYRVYLNASNLLNENYQRPHGYTHDGRDIKLGIGFKF